MKTIFYLGFTTIFIGLEIYFLCRCKKDNKFFKEVYELSPEKRMKIHRHRVYSRISFLYLVFCIAGLFSSQWIYFLLIIILSFVPKKQFTWRLIDSILSILILIFIIVNKYYFNIKLL